MSDDTTMKFKADISQLKAAMQQASRSIKVANSEFKAATAGMDKWSNSASGLQAKLKQLNTVLTAQKRQLSLAEQELEKTKKVYGENSAETDRARIKYNNFEASVKKTESQLNHYEKELHDVEHGLKDTGNAAKTTSSDVEKGSKSFTVMKGALAGLVAMGIRAAINGFRDLSRAAVDAYKEFDEGYDNVIKATGATGKVADDLEKSYKTVTKSVVGDFGDLGSALGEVNTRFGFTGKELEKSTVEFQKFATITGTDATQAVQLVSRAMGDAGIESNQYSEVLDQLAVAAQASGISVDKLTENITKYGAPMRALGFDTKESIALFSQWEKAGVNTEIAFSGMKKAISNWGKANKDPKEEFKKTLKEIERTPDIATATSKAIEVFGAKAGPDLADAIKGGRFAYEDFLKLIEGSGGAVNSTYNQTQDGFDKIKLTIQGVRAEMGDFVGNLLSKYEPQISSAIKTIASGAKSFLSWFVPNAGSIVKVLGAITVALTTMFAVNKAATFTSSLKTLITTFGALRTATTATTAATLNATAATTALSIATKAIPWVAVAAGVVAVTGGLIKYSMDAKKAAMAEYELTNAQKKTVEAAKESKKQYEETNKARTESVQGSVAEGNHLLELKDEYNGLIDSNGKVKKGYEDRASFIIGELANSLGVERSEIEKNIGANGKLKDSITNLIKTKQAEAALNADEQGYQDALKNRGKALKDYQNALNTLDSAEAKYHQTQKESGNVMSTYNHLLETNSEAADRYYRSNRSIIEANETAKASYEKAKQGVADAEKAYTGYNQTIENHEGLAAAIVSGDQKKIASSLNNLQNNFVTAKNGTRSTLQQQVKDYEANYKSLKTAVDTGMPGVSKAQVKAAKEMVDKAKAELKKLPAEAKKSGKKTGEEHAKGLSSTKGKNTSAGKKVGKAGVSGEKSGGKNSKKTGKKAGNAHASGVESTKGKNRKAGSTVGKSANSGASSGSKGMHKSGSSAGGKFASGVGSKSGSAKTAGEKLGKNANTGADSYKSDANTSGTNFSQGFINGIGSLVSNAFSKAKELAQNAWKGLKKGQDEGSPSKLTYQSGVYFVQGYINGIGSMQGSLVQTVQGMVTNVIAELGKLNGFNFAAVGENASSLFSNNFTKNVDYMIAKMTYQNETQIKDFENTIKNLESEQSKKTTKQQNKSDKKIKKLENQRDKKINKIEKKRDKLKKASDKKKLTNQIKKLKKTYKKQIDAEKSHNKKAIKATETSYKKLIATQESYKDAYSSASSAMLEQFQQAVSEYQQKAQELIDNTINGITEKYNQRYDELIGKQDNLIEKMKSAGDLFEISGAGVITVNDLKEQTKQINDYAEKLKQIKAKVSSELFDQITSYDMKEGSAFISQLLAMSANDLDAYNKAYTEKMQAAKSQAESIYKADFDKVKKDYENEINNAFKGIDQQLKTLGEQAMKGFVDGLTKNTDYMDKNVITFVNAMVDQFKKELKIKSPSKVMFAIGEFTGEGFDNGLMSIVNSVQKTAGMIANAVSTPLDNISVDGVSGARLAVQGVSGVNGMNNNNVINNYNLVQNNSSPKPLTALETYQARRRQIAMMKAATAN